MISKGKHQKHPPMVRSTIGTYHRCEWAIYGTGCGNIEKKVDDIRIQLSQYAFGYVDADHSEEKNETSVQVGKKQFDIDRAIDWNHFDDRLSLHNVDAALINGNHYSADRQIVIIDPNKKESLLRRVGQLTNIDVVIIDEQHVEIFDFIKVKMTTETLVVFQSDIEALTNHLKNRIESSRPELKAVVLAGGKSQRMGKDKSQIIYHDELTQEDYMVKLLESKGLETYLSKGADYKTSNPKVIKDRLVNMGPFGAIISAMIMDPNAAWLVVACDLPFVDAEAMNRLINSRNASKYATAYKGAENPFPEPLIAIYEPRSYQRFLSFLSLGYACPRKVLINSDIQEIVIQDSRSITNVNNPEQLKAAKLKMEDEQ